MCRKANRKSLKLSPLHKVAENVHVYPFPVKMFSVEKLAVVAYTGLRWPRSDFVSAESDQSLSLPAYINIDYCTADR